MREVQRLQAGAAQVSQTPSVDAVSPDRIIERKLELSTIEAEKRKLIEEEESARMQSRMFIERRGSVVGRVGAASA